MDPEAEAEAFLQKIFRWEVLQRQFYQHPPLDLDAAKFAPKVMGTQQQQQIQPSREKKR